MRWTLLAIFFAAVVGCGGDTSNKPIVAPNPVGADCLAERQKMQLDCVQRFKTASEIDKCITDAELPDCRTEAGVVDYITSRDAGSER